MSESADDKPAPRVLRLTEVNPQVPFWGGPLEVLRNLRAHRHLAGNIIARDVRLKYRDSTLGYVWSLLEPLMLAAIYYFLYVVLSHAKDPKQPLWIILGVITYQTFSKTLTSAMVCLSKNESMIKQIYFPRELFAVTSAGSEYVLGMLSLVVIAPLMIYYGIAPSVYLLLIPFGMALASMLGLGIGLLLAPLNVLYRDVEHLMKFVTRVGVFLSPVLWTIEMTPKNRTVLLHYVLYNPLTLPISLVRDGVSGRLPPMPALAVATSLASAIFVLLLGAAIFKRYEARVIKKL